MSHEQTPTIAEWIQESANLRKQLVQLESVIDKGTVSSAQLTELIHMKEHVLNQYASLMEQQMKDSEETARQLNLRNEELENSMAVLQLYQMIFENEPAGIIGVDRQSRIIQFNSSAIRYFGVGLHALRLQQVSQLRLEGVADAEQPDFQAMFQHVIESQSDASLRVSADMGRIYVRCYRLEDAGGLRGVVIRAIAEAIDGGASGFMPRVVLAQNTP